MVFRFQRPNGRWGLISFRPMLLVDHNDETKHDWHIIIEITG
ncbi:MAG: hypothetical protein BMS9Abin11_0820 [Gammaproteobacteria bacterium]|nr:MAG: hypothetical protein BMS9Abin11_0820 [Gammaproteobacteria bacterium]